LGKIDDSDVRSGLGTSRLGQVQRVQDAFWNREAFHCLLVLSRQDGNPDWGGERARSTNKPKVRATSCFDIIKITHTFFLNSAHPSFSVSKYWKLLSLL
jgi:hypothetical protein